MITLSTQNQNAVNSLAVNSIHPRIIDCNLHGLNQTEVVTFIASLAGKNAIVVDANPMGSSKTLNAAAVAEKMHYDSFLALAHRIGLMKSLSSIMKLTYYGDVERGEYVKNLATCINSISKHQVSKRFKNVVVDEFRQTLESILLSDTIDNKKEIFDEFVALLNMSDFTLCLDADFNQFCYDFILAHTTKTIYRIHRDVEPHNKEMIELRNNNALRVHAVKNYRAGGNFIMGVTSINEAKRNVQYFHEQGIKKEHILTITGENKGDKRVIAFFENPNEECLKYRIIIYTPVLTSGLSITVPHFDTIYMIIGRVLPSNENLQMTARNRYAKTVYCSFSKHNNGELPTDVNKLIEGSLKQRLRFNLDMNTGIVKSETQLEPLELLQLRLTVEINKDLNNYREGYLSHAESAGYKVKRYIDIIKQVDDPSTNGLQKRTKTQRIAEIYQAPLLSESDAKVLENSNAPTQEESNALHRYKTTRMAGTDEIVDTDVEHYVNGDYRVVLRHESLTKSKLELELRDKEKWRNNGKFISSSGLATIAQEILAMVLVEGQIIDKAFALKICQHLASHSAELVANGFTDYSKKTQLERPIQTLRNFLAKFGFKLQFLKQIGTVKRERIYKVIVVEHIAIYTERREQLKSGVMHNSEVQELKKNNVATVRSFRIEDFLVKIKKLLSVNAPVYQNFEFAT